MSTLIDIEAEDICVRMRGAVSLAWSLFAKKVGAGLIEVNKEASMQLQFGFILQQMLPLITFRQGEVMRLELETGTKVGDTWYEMDVLLSGLHNTVKHRIAIELKCYKTLAASGGKRGATDIFMKDVFEDLELLEKYVDHSSADVGIALIMTDMQRLVLPSSKEAKCWSYDISHGAKFGPGCLDIPIGGKPVRIELKRQYELQWIQYGQFWFLEVEGIT